MESQLLDSFKHGHSFGHYLFRPDGYEKKETIFMPLWKMRKGDAISFLLSIPMIQVSNLKRCHGKTIVLMNEQLDSPYF